MVDVDDFLEVREAIIDNSAAVCYSQYAAFCDTNVTYANGWVFIYYSGGAGALIAPKNWSGGVMQFKGNGIAVTIDTVPSGINYQVLGMQSTTKGFLPPRMTNAQAAGITNTQGLLVYSTDGGKLKINTGAGWQTITSV